jgi:hypothetical protein
VTPENPYVGPRPFERADAGRFFGRDRDARDLASMIVAHRVVLLYSASGAGKSSLVNAGVVPLLERKAFDVLPVARVGVLAVEPPANVFAGTLAIELGGGDSIAAAMQARTRELDDEGEPVPRLLVIDQFEELFTAHPEHWSHRAGLFDELRDALDADEQLRLLLGLREEYLAQLEPYSRQLPGGLKVRFRLDRLDRAAALDAVTRPLEGSGRSFAPGVAETLVDDLLKLRVDTGAGESVEVPGEFVEPVHLQVVCSRLWAELPPEVTTIRADDIRELADLDTVLARFYEEALAAAQFETHVSESRLRRWVREELITPGGTRSTAYRGRDETGGLPNAAVEVLEDKRLVRAEQRAGALWYELTHDRLITPIRASERVAAARQRRRMLVVVLTAAVLLAAACGILLGWVLQSASSGELRAADELTLARRFAPILRLDSDELSIPISRSAYLSRTTLKQETNRQTRILDPSPKVRTLPEESCRAQVQCFLFLDVRGAEPHPPGNSALTYLAIQSSLIRSGASPTIYYHVTRDPTTDEYAVQYWFLYLFNYRINEHESDWEHITVRLDGDREPVDVYYSAYSGGYKRPFTSVAKGGSHPVVYPARGSHANYFEPGRHVLAVTCKRVIGTIRQCIRGRSAVLDVSDGRGHALGLDDYALAAMNGPVFAGAYGSGNYVGLTRQPDDLRDPRTRAEWADPLRVLRQ